MEYHFTMITEITVQGKMSSFFLACWDEPDVYQEVDNPVTHLIERIFAFAH